MTDINDIDNAIFSYSLRMWRIADSAMTHLSRLPKGSIIEHLRLPLDVAQCAELRLLTEAGYQLNWQYANMTLEQLEAVTPNYEVRENIERFMATQGLQHGVGLREEMLRVLQGRRENIFEGNPKMAEVLNQPIDEFMRECCPDYLLALDGYEIQATVTFLHLPRVQHLIAAQRNPLRRDFIRQLGSTQRGEKLIGKFDRALEVTGLWFSFAPTEAERAVWPHS